MWPVDKVIDFQSDDESMSPAMRSPFSILNGSRNVTSPRRTSLSSVSEAGDPPIEDLRTKVIKSGAVPISETNIFVLSDQALTGPISKVKVPFVQNGELEKLVVNALIVVFVP